MGYKTFRWQNKTAQNVLIGAEVAEAGEEGGLT